MSQPFAGSDIQPPLLELRGLSKRFSLRKGFWGRDRIQLAALRQVDCHLAPGEVLGLVGESGCGKSTLARCVLRLERADEGEVHFKGQDILKLGRGELRRLRRSIQVVFQDPYASLNPRQRVGSIVTEPLRVHGLARGAELRRREAQLLGQVGIDPSLARRYPYEFSGGQRQRISIARALALSPELLIADEPVSALDVSVQAQILGLLAALRAELGLALLIISHDLAVMRQVCDRVAVMYLGQIVETAPSEELFSRPRHPYTQALLEAVPRAVPGVRRARVGLLGDPPSAASIPSGCPFHPRCPQALPECAREEPPEIPAGALRGARCLLPAAQAGEVPPAS